MDEEDEEASSVRSDEEEAIESVEEASDDEEIRESSSMRGEEMISSSYKVQHTREMKLISLAENPVYKIIENVFGLG